MCVTKVGPGYSYPPAPAAPQYGGPAFAAPVTAPSLDQYGGPSFAAPPPGPRYGGPSFAAAAHAVGAFRHPPAFGAPTPQQPPYPSDVPVPYPTGPGQGMPFSQVRRLSFLSCVCTFLLYIDVHFLSPTR